MAMGRVGCLRSMVPALERPSSGYSAKYRLPFLNLVMKSGSIAARY